MYASRAFRPRRHLLHANHLCVKTTTKAGSLNVRVDGFLRRSYASINTVVHLNLKQAEQAIAEPNSLAGYRTVQLNTDDCPKWDWERKDQDPTCYSAFSRVLGALGSTKNIDNVTIDPSNILSLPLSHITKKEEEYKSRTPVTILQILGISAKCVGLGRWTLDAYPTIEIKDPILQRLMHEAQVYRDDRTAWEHIVAKKSDIYKAFDYTADFHSRDMTTSDLGTPFIDLGPYGRGWYRFNMDELSVGFANDLKANTEYFAREEWRPRLYDEIRKKDGVVHSNFGPDRCEEDGELIILG